MANAFFRSIYVLSLAALIGCIRDLDDLPALNLDNGLGRTPQMGWNSWNFFKCYVDEKVIIETADAMIKTGLASAGYNYVNVDDCWAELHRDSNGNLTARNTTFPSGIKSLADYVHSKGLKFGIYSDAGYYTCQRQPGSLGYEIQDAETFASWGVDYLKYDNCFNGGIKPQIRYKAMGDALNQTGRHIFYSICEWGRHDPAKWASAIGNSWRTTEDIKDTWKRVVKIADENNRWASYAGPGGWNDPDMLEVGNGGLSWEESRSHFSIWALMKAPLIIGCDVRNVTQEYLNIFLNKEVIAVNQDSLGVQGIKVSRQGLWKCREVWAGPLSENRTVVALWNRCANTAMIEANWKDIGIDPAIPLAGRNIWKHEDIGVHWGSFNASVAPHACEMYIFSPISSLNYSETPEDQRKFDVTYDVMEAKLYAHPSTSAGSSAPLPTQVHQLAPLATAREKEKAKVQFEHYRECYYFHRGQADTFGTLILLMATCNPEFLIDSIEWGKKKNSFIIQPEVFEELVFLENYNF